MYSSTSRSDTTNTSKSVAQNVNEAADHVISKVSKVGHNVQDAISSTKNKVVRVSDKTRRHVEEKPVQSALLALGMGYILGRLFKH